MLWLCVQVEEGVQHGQEGGSPRQQFLLPSRSGTVPPLYPTLPYLFLPLIFTLSLAEFCPI